jgi:hypothetical protein
VRHSDTSYETKYGLLGSDKPRSFKTDKGSKDDTDTAIATLIESKIKKGYAEVN